MVHTGNVKLILHVQRMKVQRKLAKPGGVLRVVAGHNGGVWDVEGVAEQRHTSGIATARRLHCC